MTLAYEWKRWNAAIAWNYVDGYDEDVNQSNYEDPDIRKVSAYNTFDLRIGYKVPRVEVDLAFGINNVFNEKPPLVQSSFENNYDRSVGDIRGRMWFVSASKTF
jgi:outer membrane receptor protein involved in Fe transport